MQMGRVFYPPLVDADLLMQNTFSLDILVEHQPPSIVIMGCTEPSLFIKKNDGNSGSPEAYPIMVLASARV